MRRVLSPVLALGALAVLVVAACGAVIKRRNSILAAPSSPDPEFDHSELLADLEADIATGRAKAEKGTRCTRCTYWYAEDRATGIGRRHCCDYNTRGSVDMRDWEFSNCREERCLKPNRLSRAIEIIGGLFGY